MKRHHLHTLPVPASPCDAPPTGGSDYADGSDAHPLGTAQYPNALYGYASPPPWNAPGIDYYVGIDSRTTLTNWYDLAVSGVVTGVDTATGRIDVAGTGTIEGVDFTVPKTGGASGSWIYCTTTGSAITFKNCKFGPLPPGVSMNILVQTTNCDLTVTQCLFDGGTADEAFIYFAATGAVSITYNRFTQGWQHVLSVVSGVVALTYKYNLIDEMATGPASHENHIQWGAIGAGSTADVQFNTVYKSFLSPGVNANQSMQFYGNTSGNLSSVACDYNVFIYVGTDTLANAIQGDVGASSASSSHNYFDVRGSIYGGAAGLPSGAFYTGSVAGWTVTGNINMLDGSTITP